MPETPTTYAEFPERLDSLEALMRERWAETDRELAEKATRARAIRACLIERRTRDGNPLTERGAARLLDELERLYMRLTIVMLEGCDLAERCAVSEHNRRLAALRGVADDREGAR